MTSSPDDSMQFRLTSPEVIQAAVVLAHFHAFSSFILGCANFQRIKDQEDESKSRREAFFVNLSFLDLYLSAVTAAKQAAEGSAAKDADADAAENKDAAPDIKTDDEMEHER